LIVYQHRIYKQEQFRSK